MAKRRGAKQDEGRQRHGRQARNRSQAVEGARDAARSVAPTPSALSRLTGPTGPVAAQAAYVSNPDLPAAHRRRVVAQIGRVAGNRHVQRVVEGSREPEPKVQRVWDPPELQSNGIRFLRQVNSLPTVYNDYELRARSDEDPNDLTAYGREGM
jgi:hypothetical protein